ncbi:MAG: choice-of-anchor B family protein [Rhodothermales bacterium]
MNRIFLSFLTLALLAVAPVLGQSFGSTMAVSGDQILAGVAGGPVSSGSVYVFTAGAGDAWVESSVVKATDMNDGFGRSISVDGNRMAVGAPGASTVHFFEKGADGAWSGSGHLSESDIEGFGGGVALNGEHLLVSVSGGFRGAGSVHAYRWQNGEWMSTGALAVESEEEIPSYAAAVALHNGHAVVGAPFASERAGAAYAFRFDTMANSWVTNGSPTPAFSSGGGSFGSSILLTDGHLVVGAPGHDGRMGAVAVFDMDADSGEWTFQSRIAPGTAQRGDSFGSSLSTHGDALFIGAPGTGGHGVIHAIGLSSLSTAGTATMAMWARDLPEGASFGANIAVGSGVAAIAATGMDNRSGRIVPFAIAGDGSWSQGMSFFRDPDGYTSITGGMVECENDEAAGFPCRDVNMVSFLDMDDLGADRGVRTNDIWGWEDPETGREYALVGLTNATSFVDVTDPENPIMLGTLPLTETARPSVWRDMKVYKDHTYIVADGAGQHGMQVFDLRQLRNVQNPPVVFEMTNYYDQIASAHNIVINEETGFAYSVGSSSGGTTCGGGLHMISLEDPANPTFAGCFQDNNTGRRGTGYSHDAQCVVYRGPDSDYSGREICLGSNETALSIADVTDKSNPTAIAYATYPKVAYAHQGWLTEDHRYFYMNDEGDEPQGLVEGTRTLIWDLVDLDEPQLVGEYIATTTETDHNLYVKGNMMYQSNYGAGFRVLDVTNPTAPVEVAYFDTSPVGGSGGSWSNYPYFKSGTIVVTGGSNGLFILRKKELDL